jgi:hypothetical protein
MCSSPKRSSVSVVEKVLEHMGSDSHVLVGRVGTTSTYTLARLHRDRPDLAQLVWALVDAYLMSSG